MNDAQEDALDVLRDKGFEVTATAALPDGRVQATVTNGSTPYFFIEKDGQVEDEDGNGVGV